MAASNFTPCMAVVFTNEGGYVNNPADPGGETKYGISKAAYPSLDIANMTMRDASLIYRRDYWDRLRGDDLPLGVDLVAFDAGVNSGTGQGAKWVQMAVNASSGAGIAVDGGIGPQTLAALANCDPAHVINLACDQRLAFLQSLSTWDTFGAGWGNRVSYVRTVALKMAQP